MITTRDKDNQWLRDSARIGLNDTISNLCEKHYVDINSKDNLGYTALMEAAQNGQTETVSLLLKLGASIDEQDNNGNTALFNATIFDQAEVVSLLLENKANINIKNYKDQTLLMFAKTWSNQRKSIALIENWIENQSLLKSIADNNPITDELKF